MSSVPAKRTVCPSCGFTNAGAPPNGRCASCGALMEELKAARDAATEKHRRYQQEGFSSTWCGIAIVVQAVLTASVLIGLPMLVSALDFEGSAGMAITIPVWFVGGILVGLMSPGKTFLEPVVAAVVVGIPTVSYLVSTETIRVMPLFMYVVMALIGALFTVIGSWVGERIQMGPPPSATET